MPSRHSALSKLMKCHASCVHWIFTCPPGSRSSPPHPTPTTPPPLQAISLPNPFVPTSAADLNKNPSSRYVLDATHELCVCHGGGQVCSFECCVKFLMVVLSVQCAASWWELACFDALDRLLFLRNTQQSQHLSFKTCLSTPVLYETALFFAEHSPHSICHSFKPVFIRQCCMRLSVFAEHSCHNICHCFKSLLADLQEICLLFLQSTQQSKHLSFEICLLTPVLLETVVSAEHSCHSICHCFKPVLLHQYFIIKSTPSLC